MRIMAIAAGLAAASAATPGSAQTKVEMRTGVEYERGDYGTGESIETQSVPVGVEMRSGRVTLSATLPWQRIEGPGNAVGGSGPLGLPILIDPTRPAARTVREGVGDLRVGASYNMPADALGGFALSLSGQVKVPTASARDAMGTGETDYAVGAEVSRRVGAITPFASLAYTVAGDPEAYDLRNGLSGSAGTAVGLSAKVRGHVAYGYAQSLSPQVPDEQQISTGLSAEVGKRLSVGAFGSAGLSKGAPDVGAGLTLGIRM